ncbi:MAG: HEPN domain-containing protein [Bacteroidota bacterium]
MNKSKEDLILFRLQKAAESIELARFSISRKFWNAAASELYYTCFYNVLALFAKYDINTSTHAGVNTVFGLQFIKEGKLEAKWGRLIRVLFDMRQKSDYGDFMILTEGEVLPFIEEVLEFEKIIRRLLQEE